MKDDGERRNDIKSAWGMFGKAKRTMEGRGKQLQDQEDRATGRTKKKKKSSASNQGGAAVGGGT